MWGCIPTGTHSAPKLATGQKFNLWGGAVLPCGEGYRVTGYAQFLTELAGVRDREYQVVFSDNSNFSPPQLGLILLYAVASSQFLRASAMLKHVLVIGWTPVRPSVRLYSVRLSVTRWYCIKTAEHTSIAMFSSPHDCTSHSF